MHTCEISKYTYLITAPTAKGTLITLPSLMSLSQLCYINHLLFSLLFNVGLHSRVYNQHRVQADVLRHYWR